MGRQGDTIAAVATPAGPGAIGILRLSGPGAADIAAACFRPLGRKGLLDHPTRTLVYGSLLDCEGQVIDQVLCTYSRGPASYTGEDTAELHCHGSPMVLSLGLEALFAQGARQAGPGEFTQRAFLNGRLDLAQAEGVADLLDARSREGARQAAGQLSGALSRKIAAIYSALVDVMAHFHAVLDYPDEDIDPFTQEQLARDLEAQRQDLEALLSTYQRGRRLSRGVKCAIVGRPNAGKSSLLNTLAGYDRAIVTDIPGTTRDTVEETVELGGIPLRLIDTAGLRDSSDPIEQLGHGGGGAHPGGAGSVPARPGGGRRPDPGGCRTRPHHRGPEQAGPALPAGVDGTAGPGRLRPDLRQNRGGPGRSGGVGGPDLPPGSRLRLWGAAHQPAPGGGRRTRSGVRPLGRRGPGPGVTPDALLTDVEEALSALGELTGQSVRDDVTDRIFQRFCVGK